MSRRIGYAPGAYDLFHVGHLNILRHAKSQCDYLIAGVVSDEMCELTKGKSPVIPLAERLEIVSHISYVDEAVAEVVPDKLETWESVQFNVLFKGDDWRGTAKGEKLERDFAAGGRRGRLLPVHHAHLQQPAAASTRRHRRRARTAQASPADLTARGSDSVTRVGGSCHSNGGVRKLILPFVVAYR